MWQNSFNQVSDNLILLFTRKKHQNQNRSRFKKVSTSISMPPVVVSCDPLFPTPSTSLAIKTPENTEEDSDGTVPAFEGDTQKWNTPLISCTAQAYRNRNQKNYQ
jgi:hypothetical protein